MEQLLEKLSVLQERVDGQLGTTKNMQQLFQQMDGNRKSMEGRRPSSRQKPSLSISIPPSIQPQETAASVEVKRAPQANTQDEITVEQKDVIESPKSAHHQFLRQPANASTSHSGSANSSMNSVFKPKHLITEKPISVGNLFTVNQPQAVIKTVNAEDVESVKPTTDKPTVDKPSQETSRKDDNKQKHSTHAKAAVWSTLMDKRTYLAPMVIEGTQTYAMGDIGANEFVFHPNCLVSLVWASIYQVILGLFFILLPIFMCYEELWSALVPLILVHSAVVFIDSIMISITARLINSRLEMSIKNIQQDLKGNGTYIINLIGLFPWIIFKNAIPFDNLKQVYCFHITCLLNLLPFFMSLVHSDRPSYLRVLFNRSLRKWHANVALTSGIKIVLAMILYWHWSSCATNLLENAGVLPPHAVGAKLTEKYVSALFYAASETFSASWGVPEPTSTVERGFKIVNFIICALLEGVFVGNIASFMIGLDSSGRLFTEKMEELDEYISYKKFPKELADRVRAYFHFKYSDSKYFDEDRIIRELSDPLKQSISLRECEALVVKVPFFKGAEIQFIKQLVLKMKLKIFLAEDKLIEEGSVGDEMFFISEGTVEVYVGGIARTKMQAGSFFGEIALVLGKQRRTATIIAKTNCKLFSLSRGDLEQAMSGYPAMALKMIKVAEQRLAEDREKARKAEEEKRKQLQREDQVTGRKSNSEPKDSNANLQKTFNRLVQARK
ncbi:hypothetical protein EDD86DRAFT_267935 [Gorgonomyces haynaldii]|nr:hypothetical protein EDD86DRAFT_267935 [Gorgonomyces haynaldii]